jgi:hypothetical protein
MTWIMRAPVVANRLVRPEHRARVQGRQNTGPDDWAKMTECPVIEDAAAAGSDNTIPDLLVTGGVMSQCMRSMRETMHEMQSAR